MVGHWALVVVIIVVVAVINHNNKNVMGSVVVLLPLLLPTKDAAVAVAWLLVVVELCKCTTMVISPVQQVNDYEYIEGNYDIG